MTTELKQLYEDRKDEIEDYFLILKTVDEEFQKGSTPKVNKKAINPREQRVMYSVMYVMLYNLVESIMTKFPLELSQKIENDKNVRYADLNDLAKKEWVRHHSKSYHKDTTDEVRYKAAIEMTRNIESGEVLKDFVIDRLKGGNWENELIENYLSRLGINVDKSQDLTDRMLKFIDGKQGSMAYLRSQRNKLAHGEKSFSEVVAEKTLQDIQDLKDIVLEYMSIVVKVMDDYIINSRYRK